MTVQLRRNRRLQAYSHWSNWIIGGGMRHTQGARGSTGVSTRANAQPCVPLHWQWWRWRGRTRLVFDADGWFEPNQSIDGGGTYISIIRSEPVQLDQCWSHTDRVQGTINDKCFEWIGRWIDQWKDSRWPLQCSVVGNAQCRLVGRRLLVCLSNAPGGLRGCSSTCKWLLQQPTIQVVVAHHRPTTGTDGDGRTRGDTFEISPKLTRRRRRIRKRRVLTLHLSPNRRIPKRREAVTVTGRIDWQAEERESMVGGDISRGMLDATGARTQRLAPRWSFNQVVMMTTGPVHYTVQPGQSNQTQDCLPGCLCLRTILA